MLSPYGYGILPAQPDVWFEVLEAPAEYADFSYDASGFLVGTDYITALSMVALPSGAGEVTLSRLTLSPNVNGLMSLITVWVTGGIPGRTYLYQLNITTFAARINPVLIGHQANPVLAQCPLPPPPSPGFGTPVTWTFGGP